MLSYDNSQHASLYNLDWSERLQAFVKTALLPASSMTAGMLTYRQAPYLWLSTQTVSTLLNEKVTTKSVN